MRRSTLIKLVVIGVATAAIYHVAGLFMTAHGPTWNLFGFAMAGGVMLAIWLWIINPDAIRQERRRRGQCIKCGYDLRASQERCPECGAKA